MSRVVASLAWFVLLASSHPAQRQPATDAGPSKVWKLAFVREDNIWVANGDGSGQRLVVKNGYSPCWSPDRKLLAFTRNGRVWIANADGTDERLLTSAWPVVSGSRLAGLSWDRIDNIISVSRGEEFEVKRNGEKEAKRIGGLTLYDVPLDGGTTIVRFDLFDAEAACRFSKHQAPAWSPSGKRLAFVRNGDIWIAERREKRDVEGLRDRKDWTAWGWDVTRLAAVALYDAPTYRGSRENCHVTCLSWSTDEKLLAYGIHTINGSGFEQVRVLRLKYVKYQDAHAEASGICCEDGFTPCFSPDGNLLAFTQYSDLFCVSLNGKVRRKLANNAHEAVW